VLYDTVLELNGFSNREIKVSRLTMEIMVPRLRFYELKYDFHLTNYIQLEQI
jgi:hypothetical protein